MFGLAALAAVAAMAFVGASSASANQDTTFCKVANELPCVNNQYPSGTHIEGKATGAKLLTSENIVLCSESIALGETLNQLAKPLLVKLTLLDFTGCHVEGVGSTSCTTTYEAEGATPRHLLVLKTSYNNADVQGHGIEIRLKCLLFGFITVIDCRYTGLVTLKALGQTDAGELATLHANELPLSNLGEEGCPAEGKWDALYKIVLPHPLYISS